MTIPASYSTIVRDGVVTHVVVPLEDFQKLGVTTEAPVPPPSDDEINAALRVLGDTQEVWHDASRVLGAIMATGIEELRRSSGITQQELARAIGISQAQVSRIERAPANASLAMLRRIAEALASLAALRHKSGGAT